MNDHWCAQSHKKERNWLIEQFQKLGMLKKLRITFLSGDVHCAAVVNHKALLRCQTNEDMINLFKFDTNGNKLNNPRFMARRNYCAVRLVDDTDELEFNIRVEIQQGEGITKGYPVIVPPPNF
ncbi:hypothetical protein PPACK8108_LOCUS1699 [Phakopsora pachyrhizi]|uniref:PhoD-like phosphatase domain-containing protein n=1 Tax=Phakopsora pachyrhizi TaxID=170000 RepID=A0AAV0AHK2_PHAPC|nr:hypothetical protein PPACK8108_LOCUS1699 [Phakopsora pachyrhizi]